MMVAIYTLCAVSLALALLILGQSKTIRRLRNERDAAWSCAWGRCPESYDGAEGINARPTFE